LPGVVMARSVWAEVERARPRSNRLDWCALRVGPSPMSGAVRHIGVPANRLGDVSIVRLVLSFPGDQTALSTAMARRATPATAVLTYRLSVARSRLLLRPSRRLRHTRAENRCERCRAAYSMTATAPAAATQPHEPQNSAALTTGQRAAGRRRSSRIRTYRRPVARGSLAGAMAWRHRRRRIRTEREPPAKGRMTAGSWYFL
jgi:hypothetical protein